MSSSHDPGSDPRYYNNNDSGDRDRGPPSRSAGYGGGGGGGAGGSAGFHQHRNSYHNNNNNDGGRGGTSSSSSFRHNDDREIPRGRGGGGFGNNYNNNYNNHHRGQIIMGLDINPLVDRLTRPNADVYRDLQDAMKDNPVVFESGKALTAIISNLARRRNLRIANLVWGWMDTMNIEKNTFHYNSMISCCEKVRDYSRALRLLDDMKSKVIAKNEVTFSSAISACEKCGQWRVALDLLEQMKKEGAGKTAIAYNAAISACEKGLVPHKALEIFEQMKRDGVQPTVVTYSALISAAEKGQQWKLALEVLEEMKAAGHGANVIAYSAAISALSKGQQWHKAWELFREIEASGGKPSIVTYNATMTALEKGLQWERALDLFDEMKTKNMPVTVVSYGSAISACEKGLQYRQCLEFLDEMTQMGIKKNVIIFGAAMACMEKSCRADIAFQLMERMKMEDVAPNVHIYNSAISACARCNLWEKGYELFKEMDEAQVRRDVVSYNAVLDAVCSQVDLGRALFKEGIEKGFYARVSRLGTQWLELDVHFLSLGGGEIALGWWFEECLVPYLVDTNKLDVIQSISIVTGYGKTRSRGARMNDDGMRKRVGAMLKCMDVRETPQPNKGRIHIDKQYLIEVVNRNGGKIVFDQTAYTQFKEEETTANKFPDAPQQVRPRFRPALPGEGPAGTFVREGDPLPPQSSDPVHVEPRRESPVRRSEDGFRRSSSYMAARDERPPERASPGGSYDRPSESYGYDVRNTESRGSGRYGNDRGDPRELYREDRGNGFRPDFFNGHRDRRGGYHEYDRRHSTRQSDYDDRRISERDMTSRNGIVPSREYDADMRGVDRRRDYYRDRDRERGSSRSSYYDNDRRRSSYDDSRSRSSAGRFSDRRHDGEYLDYNRQSSNSYRSSRSDAGGYANREDGHSDAPPSFRAERNDPEAQAAYQEDGDSPLAGGRKRTYEDYNKQQPSRGYDIQPAFTKHRSS